MPDAPHLQAPLRLGALSLPNRIVAGPAAPPDADDGGTIDPRVLPHYARAASTAGLVIAEPAWVTPQGAGTLRGAGIARDAHVAAWSAVTDAVHGAGGRIALPLWHAGRRAHPRVQPHRGWPVAPSDVAAPGEAETIDGPRAHPQPRPLDATELPALIETFASAAERALRAGFDAVEIPAADDGLIEQFLRPGSNRRTDRYGTDHDGGTRLLLEIVDAVTARIGADRLGIRLDVAERAVAARLAGRGLAWLHVVPAANGIRPPPRPAFDGPVILGGAWSAEEADATVVQRIADAVVLTPLQGADTAARQADPARRPPLPPGPGRFVLSPT